MMHEALFIGFEDRLDQAYPESLRQRLSRRFRFSGPVIPRGRWQEFRESLARAEVLFATWGLPRLDREFLDAAPNLRAIFYAAGSMKLLTTEETFERDLVLSSAWEANAIPVAEYASAAALLALKRFWAYADLAKSGQPWIKDIPAPGAYRSTIGLVSLGAVGRHVAGILGRFDLDLVAFDPFSSGLEKLKMVSLEELFATSDAISIHTPWLPETENMIDEKLLASMRPNATLINTSRGAVIDEPALCRVLAARPDLTAILDVTHPEPPEPGSALFSLKNVVLTPHIAGSLQGEIARLGDWMADDAFAWAEGRPIARQLTAERISQLA